MSLQDLRAPGWMMAMKMAAMTDHQRTEYLRSLNEPMKEMYRRRAKGKARIGAFLMFIIFAFLIKLIMGA